MINKVVTNPVVNETEEAKSVLSDFFEHLRLSFVMLKKRISYRKFAKDALVLMELDKQALKAVNEIITLYNEVFDAKQKN